MPKASIDEDRNAWPWEDDISSSADPSQRRKINAIAKAVSVQQMAHRKFRRSVP